MYAAFERSFSDALIFVADDIQNGIKLIEEKGFIRAFGDELQIATEASVNTLESAALAGCAAPCKPPEKSKKNAKHLAGLGVAAFTVETEIATLTPAEIAMRFNTLFKSEPDNARCFDCGAGNPEVADLSFGVFVCESCSAFHRKPLASHLRHCRQDVWLEQHFRVYEHGGNARLADFLKANNASDDSQQRYFSSAACWYRDAWLHCTAGGWPAPPPPEGIVAPPQATVTVSDNNDEGEICVEAKSYTSKPVPDLLGLDDAVLEGCEIGEIAEMENIDLLNIEEFPKQSTSRAASSRSPLYPGL